MFVGASKTMVLGNILSLWAEERRGRDLESAVYNIIVGSSNYKCTIA